MKKILSSPYPRTWCNAGARCFLLCAVITLFGGCSSSLYYWGDYRDSLEQCYEKENPTQAGQLLQEQMPEYTAGKQVPPGVYADYGFLLFRRGDTTGAITYFEKEKKTFPESAYLMDKLLDRIKKKTASETKTAPTSTGGNRP